MFTGVIEMGKYYDGIVKNEYTKGLRFGKNLKHLRERYSMNISQLADLSWTTPLMIKHYEAEESLPILYTVLKISQYFKIPIDDLCFSKLTRWDVLRDAQRRYFELAAYRGIEVPDDLPSGSG